MRSATRRGSSGNVSDRVARYLVQYIWENELAPGASLPSELRASADLGVSRGIVREVYRSLNTAGIVDKATGRQPKVSRVSSRVLTLMLQHALATRQVSAQQTLELRRPIEGYAAELAAMRRTPQDIAALRAELSAMREANEIGDEFVRADIRFHEIIGRATGNPLFALVASALRESMEVSIREGLSSPRAARSDVIDTHTDIVDAIEAGDPEQARQAMALHFDEARANVLRWELERAEADVRAKGPERRRRRADKSD